MTLKEWAELPEHVDGELVDGLLVEEEMATGFHEAVVAWLLFKLMTWLQPRGGFVFPSDLKYPVGSKRGRKPDLSVFLPGNQPSPGADRLQSVRCDIAIEVITATPKDARRDRIDKAREYARYGIRWYWLVDPALRTIEILEMGPRGRYEQATLASEGRIKIPGCRGLVLNLDDLWRHVSKLER